MKTLKLTIGIIAILFVLLNLTSCKKSNDELEPKVIDITKYYIVGDYLLGTFKLPYIITFDVNAKAMLIGPNATAQCNYTYEDGTITIDLGGNNKNVFKIDNGVITSYQGFSSLQTFSLKEIPETNQFNGNSYSGGWATQGSALLLVAKFKFSGTQYGEISIGDPTINKNYTLIKNIAATSNTGANGTLSFFVIDDGQLKAGRFDPSTSKYSSGTFKKL